MHKYGNLPPCGNRALGRAFSCRSRRLRMTVRYAWEESKQYAACIRVALARILCIVMIPVSGPYSNMVSAALAIRVALVT